MDDNDFFRLIGGYANERGNTVLTSENGAFVSWVKVQDNQGRSRLLEILYQPANYPALGVCLVDPGFTVAELRQRILQAHDGWTLHKQMAGLDLHVDEDGCVSSDEPSGDA